MYSLFRYSLNAYKPLALRTMKCLHGSMVCTRVDINTQSELRVSHKTRTIPSLLSEVTP